jgi:arylsulfatase
LYDGCGDFANSSENAHGEAMKTRREFLQAGLCAGANTVLSLSAQSPAEERKGADKRPNIVFVLADDMGFSDIGCYGSEIQTPHLDELARGGLRFTDFHNSPRCCPSRASLLTGMYSHQAGMG